MSAMVKYIFRLLTTDPGRSTEATGGEFNRETNFSAVRANLLKQTQYGTHCQIFVKSKIIIRAKLSFD